MEYVEKLPFKDKRLVRLDCDTTSTFSAGGQRYFLGKGGGRAALW